MLTTNKNGLEVDIYDLLRVTKAETINATAFRFISDVSHVAQQPRINVRANVCRLTHSLQTAGVD